MLEVVPEVSVDESSLEQPARENIRAEAMAAERKNIFDSWRWPSLAKMVALDRERPLQLTTQRHAAATSSLVQTHQNLRPPRSPPRTSRGSLHTDAHADLLPIQSTATFAHRSGLCSSLTPPCVHPIHALVTWDSCHPFTICGEVCDYPGVPALLTNSEFERDTRPRRCSLAAKQRRHARERRAAPLPKISAQGRSLLTIIGVPNSATRVRSQPRQPSKRARTTSTGLSNRYTTVREHVEH